MSAVTLNVMVKPIESLFSGIHSVSTQVNPQQNICNGTHAVVMGASMAGLLAARILLEHFERVTVVERDRLPQQPETRPGVPQAHHVHVLLTQGQRILEQLFPGIQAEISATGAPSIDWAAECPSYNAWGWASLWETTTGGRPDKITQLMHRYMDKVIMLSVRNSKIHRRFVEVAHMVKSPISLFAPDILVPVLSASLNQRTASLF
ncbi:MAG: hypothetical protein SAL70_42085 [Scytonema sp. PMC 1070.18]|nr:hypothetical protein [Scytonema sp. PMC 1070.18]